MMILILMVIGWIMPYTIDPLLILTLNKEKARGWIDDGLTEYEYKSLARISLIPFVGLVIPMILLLCVLYGAYKGYYSWIISKIF